MARLRYVNELVAKADTVITVTVEEVKALLARANEGEFDADIYGRPKLQVVKR